MNTINKKALVFVLSFALTVSAFLPVSVYATVGDISPIPIGNIYSSAVSSGGIETPTIAAFQNYNYNFTAASTTTAISFLFRKDPGYFSLDDISVSDGAIELITNPGFELGTANWSIIGTPGLSAAGSVSASGKRSGSNGWYDGAVGGFDGIQQIINTTSGSPYTVSFWLRADSWGTTEATSFATESSIGITQFLFYAGELPAGFTVTPARSNLAAISTILSQTDSAPAGGNGGTTAAAITWAVSVDNASETIGLSDISVSSDATFKLYTDSAFTSEITGSSIVALASGASTTVYIKVTAQDTTTIKYYAVTINRAAPAATRHHSSAPASAQVPVIVNGESMSAGTQTETKVDGITNVNVDVNEVTISDLMDTIIAAGDGTKDNVIEIPVASKSGDTVNVSLLGDLVKKMESNSFTLKVTTNDVSYIIDSKEFKISEIAGNLGVGSDLGNIEIKINIIQPSAETIAQITAQANAQNYEIVIPPASFEVVAVNTLTKAELPISQFNNYVQRVFTLPAGADPDKITTGIVYNEDGTFSHIPTNVDQLDQKYFVKLNSLTNSTYSVIWNPITVASVDRHWAKDAVNDMASRLIIKNTTNFNPEAMITRGEFADYVSKALGIYRTGIAKDGLFKDVAKTDEYADAIQAAVDYGVINGYFDGTFKPNAKITREEAMVMFSKAMNITNLVGTDLTRVNNYTDYESLYAWSKPHVAHVIVAKVFNGMTSTKISPKSNFTKAEAATAISNLLMQSELIK